MHLIISRSLEENLKKRNTLYQLKKRKYEILYIFRYIMRTINTYVKENPFF